MTGRLIDEHLTALADALLPFREVAGELAAWGERLAEILGRGGRLLVAGNGGSAAEAQHLTAELVGKLRADRTPLSALALHAETSSGTAIANDYGFTEVFARQVRAHGRPGDVLLLISSSGRSPNLLAARCAQTIAVPSPEPQVVQELHLVAAHLLCEHVDLHLPAVLARDRAEAVAS